MAKSQAELLREALGAIARHDAQIEELRVREGHDRDRRDRQADELAAIRRELADARAETAVLRTIQAESRRQSEVWGGRWWALGVGVFLALLGVMATVTAAIIRRQP